MNSDKFANEKLFHYNDLNNNMEFEKLTINTADYSPSTSEFTSIFSDITSSETESESSDHRFTLFYSTPSCCIELNNEFEEFLQRVDLESSRNDHSLSHHPELKPSHRTILLDWMMEMCDYFKTSRDAYYQAINYLDRYLALSFNISKQKFQLVGLTCLFLASKWEDTEAIKLSRLIYLVDDIFTREDVLAAEINILQVLDFRSCLWTLNKWVCTLLHKAQLKLSLHEYAQITLLLDLIILDIECLKYSHSVLASACIFHVTSNEMTFLKYSSFQHLEICQCIFWSQKYWNALRETPLLEDRMNQLKTHQKKCSIILYSIRQFYTKLLDIYNDINKDNF